MLISYKIQTLDYARDIEKLLCQLDERISIISKTKLDSLRYGAKICKKSVDYLILVKYRQILLMKYQGDSCLKDYVIDDIISNIKQYLTVGKIQKFKKSYAPVADFSVKFNDYDRHIVYHCEANKLL